MVTVFLVMHVLLSANRFVTCAKMMQVIMFHVQPDTLSLDEGSANDFLVTYKRMDRALQPL